MTCTNVLEAIRSDFVTWHCNYHEHCGEIELDGRVAGRQAQHLFLRQYPFARKPQRIWVKLADEDKIRDFFVSLIYHLRPLGGIQAVHQGPSASKAARNLERFHNFVRLAASADSNAAEILNAWSAGKWRDERLLAKKILATYRPTRIIPAFRHADMEHFVRRLGRNRDLEVLCRTRFGNSYAQLDGGHQFEALNEILLDSKGHHPAFDEEDNVYFMYCLYAGRLRPPGMPEWYGHVGSRYKRARRRPKDSSTTAPDATEIVAEIQTGIRRGQRFCDSPQARRALELRGIEAATVHLESSGWKVRNVSSENRGYDLHCKRSAQVLMVEVKGTSREGSAVVLTRNEVNYARGNYPRAALIVVSRITLSEAPDGIISAVGGNVREVNPWALDDGVLNPIAYEYDLP